MGEITRRLFRHFTTQQIGTASLLDTPNPAPCQNIHAHHNAEQRRGQEGKSARRGDGLR